MLRWKRLEVTGGFLLLTAVLYYLDDQGILPWVALGCLLHEGGHYAAIRLLGGRVVRVRLSVSGAEMRLSARRALGQGGQLAAALAGPLANLISAFLAANLGRWLGEKAYLFAGLSLGLALFNLLPMAPLDGGRALYALTAMVWSALAAERLLRAMGTCCAVALACAGAALLWETGGNFTLLLTALWLAGQMRHNAAL